MDGSGGVGAVSIGLSPWLFVVVLIVILISGWKLAQFLFALFR